MLVSSFNDFYKELIIFSPIQVYILGEEDVPHLLTPKTEILAVSPPLSYK